MQALILIVEDNPLDLEMLMKAASRARTDFVCKTAQTFDEAVGLMAHPDHFDMVLTDFCLPFGADGADVARESVAPVVIMTGLTQEQIMERASRAGAFKVVSLDDLIEEAHRNPHGSRPKSQLEISQAVVIDKLQSELSENSAKLALAVKGQKQGVVLGTLEWAGDHPFILLSILGVVAAAIVAAVLIGHWPGG